MLPTNTVSGYTDESNGHPRSDDSTEVVLPVTLAPSGSLILIEALSYLYLVLVANQKLQDSIDPTEMTEGSEVLGKLNPDLLNFLTSTTKTLNLRPALLEKWVVDAFGPAWRQHHLLEDEDADDDVDFDETIEGEAATQAYFTPVQVSRTNVAGNSGKSPYLRLVVKDGQLV
jgi:hypothetical protein